MSDNPYTEEYVTAVEKVLGSWGIRKQRDDIARNILDAIAPAIAARARRSALLDVAEVIDEERAKWMAGSKQHVALTRLRDRVHKEPTDGQEVTSDETTVSATVHP